MESVVEDVEDQREAESSPANSYRRKNLLGWDVLRHSRGVNQSDGLFTIRSDNHIDSDAIKKTTINNAIYE